MRKLKKTRSKTVGRILTLLLAVVMCFAFVPTSSVSADGTGKKLIITHNIDLGENLVLQSGSILLDSNNSIALDMSDPTKFYRLEQYYPKYSPDGSSYVEKNLILSKIVFEHNSKTYEYFMPEHEPSPAITIDILQQELDINGTDFYLNVNASAANQKRVGFYYSALNPTTDITVHFVWATDDSPKASATVVSENEELGNGIARFLENSNGSAIWELTATPNGDYMLDYWEATEGKNATEDFVKVPDSDGQASLTVTIDKDMTYRALFAKSRLILKDSPWLYPIPSIYAPLGVRGVIEREDADGKTYYTFTNDWSYNTSLPSTDAPTVGGPASLYVQYDVLGSLLLNNEALIGKKNASDVDLSYPHPYGGGGHYIDFALYAGAEATGDPIVSLDDLVLMARGSGGEYVLVTEDGGVEFQFTMPEAMFLTARIQLDDQTPLLVTIPTGQSEELTALRSEFRTLQNLGWRYLIDGVHQDASTAMRDAETNDDKKAIVDTARSAIEGYIAGTNKDYITVSFGGNDGNIVRVKDKDSQQAAMMAALEQQYPEEKGFWYLDCNSGAFGLWLNGFGGRLFTESELSSGVLESDIKTPKHEFKAGEALPASGVLFGEQGGSLQYVVNGFYANFGITGWLCSYGDRFTWGPSGDDGIPDWDAPGGEVWALAPGFTDDANVKATLTACEALTNESSEDDIRAARSAYNAIPDTFWNAAYAKYLFQNYEPYKAAYDKLVAAENAAGITEPLPGVTYAEALGSVLGYLGTNRPEPAFGDEWAVLALARGGAALPEGYYEGYYSRVAMAVAEKVAATGVPGRLDGSKSTENSRLALALSSMGKDAKNVGGHDLAAPFSDMAWVTKQGLNGAIYALIALDAIQDTASETQSTRDSLIKYILDAALPGGGWNLEGGVADVDITAMTLQALAPYYLEVSSDVSNETTVKVNAALDWLKTKQDSATGGFLGYNNTLSACSTAQVVTALSALNIPLAQEDYGWTKAGGWNPVTALLSHYNAAGWFGEEGPAAYNGMATEQSAYALVAYDRFMNGKTRLYDMSDAKQLALGDVYSYPETGITIEADKGVLPEKARFEIAPVTSETYTELYTKARDALADIGTKLAVYDITLFNSDNVKVEQLGTTVKVSLPIPAGMDAARLDVYRIEDDDGSRLLLTSEVGGGKLTFYTDHFSLYAIVERAAASSTTYIPPSPQPAPIALTSLATLTIKAADKVWNGKKIASGFVLTAGGKRLSAGKDYTVKSTGANKNIGAGTVKIAGNGAYTGTSTVKFKIIPKAVKLTSAKAGKNSMSIKWTKAPSAEKITRYEVRWKAKGAKNWSSPKPVSAAKATYTAKKLKKGKKYDVQARAYKTVKGAKYYSAWSAAKPSAKVK
jgi:hypothetical protein